MSLQAEIGRLRRASVCRIVRRRIREFERASRGSEDSLFSELCFCILTANYNAERAIHIQEEIDNGFITLPEKKLAAKLKALRYRFPNTRAMYIVEARAWRGKLEGMLKALQGDELRHWFACNVKGLGYKEASHFLRNIGYKDYAILDFHIIDVLVDNRLIRRPKTLSRKKYLEIERILRRFSRKVNLSMAELDLYLWYMETGKVLK
ncbi:MAG: N-glycosylase/DNA lyase [Candidatus Altiarchaeota archaeon]